MGDINPSFMAALLVSIGALLFIYNQGRAAIGKDKTPQPFVTKSAVDYCPLLLHEKHREEVAESFSEMGKKVDHVEDNRRVSVAKVYEFTRQSMESQRKETKADISALRSEMKSDFAGVHDRLTDLIKQLPKS